MNERKPLLILFKWVNFELLLKFGGQIYRKNNVKKYLFHSAVFLLINLRKEWLSCVDNIINVTQ